MNAKKRISNLDTSNFLLGQYHLRYCSSQLATRFTFQHHDPFKDWDLWRLFTFFEEIDFDLLEKPNIYDMGCGKKFAGIKFCEDVLKSQPCYFASDILKVNFKALENKVDFYQGLIEDVKIAPNSIDLAISLSVIEHGVNLEKFAKVLFQSLRPGGHFFITTDFWKSQMNVGHLFPYGGEMPAMFVFSPDTLQSLKNTLVNEGLTVFEDNVSSSAIEDACVYWQRMDQRYTFGAIVGKK